MTNLTFQKIGGLYWFRIGRVRIAFCLTKAKRVDPIRLAAKRALIHRQLS